MKSHYQELYVDGPIGRLTRETSDYEVVDHTALLEDPGECNASSVTPENQLELGLLPLRNDFAPEVNDGAERILVDRPENLEPEIETLVGEMFHRQFKGEASKTKTCSGIWSRRQVLSRGHLNSCDIFFLDFWNGKISQIMSKD